MGGAALVSLIALRATLIRAFVAGDPDGSTALTTAMGWLYTLPLAVVAFSGSLHVQPDAFRAWLPVYPAWYAVASQLAILLVGVLAAMLAIHGLHRRPVTINAAALVAVLLSVVTQLAAGRAGGPLVSGRGLVLLVCLVAAVVLPRGRGPCLGVAIFGVTLGIVSALLAVIHYNVAFVVPCQGSCGGLGFRGVMPDENLLGVALTATIPFCYLGLRGAGRYWLTFYLLGMVLASGAKDASIAAVVSVVLLLTLRPRLDADRAAPGRTKAVGALLGASALGSALFVVYGVAQASNPSALSGRPLLWQVAISNIEKSPWFGYGPAAWTGLYRTSQIPFAGQRSAHNQWLDVLFASGVAGAVVLVALVIVLIRSAGLARPAVLVVLTTIAVLGTAEPVWLMGQFDILSYSLVGLVLLGPTTPSAEARATQTSRAAATASTLRGARLAHIPNL